MEVELHSFTSLTSDAPVESEATEIGEALSLLQCVRLEAGDHAGESLSTVAKVLANLLRDPTNPKFRRLRLANPQISAKVARFESSKALLQLAGFREQEDAGEQVLTLAELKENVAVLIVSEIEPSSQKAEEEKKEKELQYFRSKSDFLASVHEERLKNKASVNICASKRAPESFLQLNEYRKKHKGQHPRQARVMTLGDLEQHSAPAYTGPVPDLHSLADFEDSRNIALRAFHLTNEFRAAQHLPACQWSDGLAGIARGHSDNMSRGLVAFGHSGFNDRFRRFPFRATRRGAENVAMSNGLADAGKVAVDGWIKSPGHRKNMLGTFNFMGIGAVQAANGSWYLTQLFALA